MKANTIVIICNKILIISHIYIERHCYKCLIVINENVRLMTNFERQIMWYKFIQKISYKTLGYVAV